MKRLYSQPEYVSTTLASSGLVRQKREKSARISSRPGGVKVRVCSHQGAGLDERMTFLPQSDVYLRQRSKSPITVDFMTEPAVSNPGVTDIVQHTIGPDITFGKRMSGPSITKAIRCHKRWGFREQTERHLTGMGRDEHVHHRRKSRL